MLKRLVYSSRRVECGDGDLATILETSRQNNRREGITGILVYDDRRFVQLIEGAHDPLARCFLRIARSRLHRDIDIAALSDSETRLFGDWDMRVYDVRPRRASLSTVWRVARAHPEADRVEEFDRMFLKIDAA